IGAATLGGTNATNFTIVSDTGQTNLFPGEIRVLEVASSAGGLGHMRAALEFEAAHLELGRFSFGVALDAALLDNVVIISTNSLDFGTLNLDTSISATRFLSIRNNGTLPLDVTQLSVVNGGVGNFSLATPAPFQIPASNLVVVQVIFSPTTGGPKQATLVIESLAC